MELLSVTMNGGVMQRSEIEGKDNSSEDKSNYKVVRKGDMVYNSMRMWQGANGVSSYDGIVSPAYTVLTAKVSICNEYFAALFKNYKLINEFRKNSQGMTSDTWNLKYPQIETIKVYLPEVAEQEKVASKRFLCFYLASDITLAQYKKYAAGSCVNNLNSELVASVKIGMPPIEQQIRMANILEKIDRQVEAASTMYLLLSKLRSSLLQQLFI